MAPPYRLIRRARSPVSPARFAALAATLICAIAGTAFAMESADPDLRILNDISDAGPWTAFRVNAAGNSGSIVSGGLRVTRAHGDNVSITRGIVSPGPESVLIFEFNVELSKLGIGGGASQTFRVGSGFTDSYTDEPDASTFARLGLDAVGVGGAFQLHDATGGRRSAAFAGTQAITWVLNSTGLARTYPAPNGSVESLAAGRMDVWVGRARVFDDLRVTNPSAPIADFKWHWGAGTGTTTFGYFAARPYPDGGSAAGVALAQAPAAGAIAATEAAATPAGPTGLELYRPSPNPFDRTMRFAYAVSGVPKRVDIGVYDVAGRKIRALAAGLQGPGRYEVGWDGRGDNGARAHDGVYFLRAAIGSDDRVVRIVYVRD